MGRAANHCPDLCKSWAEQLDTRKICANPAGMVGWKDCAILEPSRLSERIVQFLEGRMVALQKCAIFKGNLLSLQLDQVWVSSF